MTNENQIPAVERENVGELPLFNSRGRGYHPDLESLRPGETNRKIVGRDPRTGEPVEADVKVERIERDPVTGAVIRVESYETPEALRPDAAADGGGVRRGK